MKRIIALLCAVILMLTLVGCGERTKEEGYSVDIEYFLKTGQVKEAQFNIGTPIKDIEKEIAKHSEEGEGTLCQGDEIVLVEGTDYNYYNAPDFYYYYNVGNEDNGISCIVGFTDMYGFSVGQTGEYTIKSALEQEKLEVIEGIADEDEFFFMPFSIENCKKLSCTIENNVLVFYFENDALIAGVIYDKENWAV